MSYLLRKATIPDVKAMHALLLESGKKGELLPRSFNSLFSHLRDFFVAVEQDEAGEEVRLVGCCALSITWDDLAEIRSLIVADDARSSGLGGRLVDACLSEAVTLGIYKVFTLTYRPGFFSRFGFNVITRDSLPEKVWAKVWADCIHCPQFPDCDETAMMLEL